PTETSAVWFPDDGLDFDRYIEAVELSLIRRSLERTQGNKRQAAKLLNLKRTTLIEKLKRLDPQREDSACSDATTLRLLDDHSRGEADRVPGARRRGTDADAAPAAGAASRRGDEVVRA